VSVLTVVLVAAAWVVVGWLPGYLLVDALRPAAGWLRNAALAPMAALGLTMIAGQGLQILRVRIDPWTVLPLSIGVPLLGWDDRNVAVQFSFVERPDHFFRGLTNHCAGRTHSKQSARVLLDLFQFALESGWGLK